MQRYKPEFIDYYVERLETRADFAVVVNVIVGAIFGVAVGYVFGDLLPTRGVSWLIVAVIGGIMGYWRGNGIALECRIKAQTLLCQAQIEENTRPTASVTTPSVAISRPSFPAAATQPSSSAAVRSAPIGVRKCPECRAEVPRLAEFCPKCSARLPR